MKKVSITSLSFILLLLATVATSCSKNLASFSDKPDAPVWENNQQTGEPVSKKDVNAKVVKSFYRSYGEQTAANWTRTARGFNVTFKNDGVNTLVYYTPGGREESKLRFYFENKLPAEVRHIVKSNFYDYSILYVTEVQKNDATAFYIKMQDSSTLKTIRLVNEDWDVVEDLARLH
ncbi:MAG: hypothetical protein QM791_12260 [Ferruginibacter sp.]